MTGPHICLRGSGFACPGRWCGEAIADAVPVGDPSWHPCGHAERTRGCGGCDPGAIELQVLDDGTVLREGDPGWHDLRAAVEEAGEPLELLDAAVEAARVERSRPVERPRLFDGRGAFCPVVHRLWTALWMTLWMTGPVARCGSLPAHSNAPRVAPRGGLAVRHSSAQEVYRDGSP